MMMKKEWVLAPVLFAAFTFAGAAWAQAPRVVLAPSIGALAGKEAPPERARLLLKLRAGGDFGAIRAAQDRVLARLSGTSARLIGRPEAAALEIEAGPDALPALMALGDLVEEIREEPPLPSAEVGRNLTVKTAPR